VVRVRRGLGGLMKVNLSEGELADILHCIDETSACERPRRGLARRLWIAFIQEGGDPEQFPLMTEEYGIR
jgi:hypothetical protein